MVTDELSIPAGAARLAGDLAVPSPAAAVVLFAHGSGSSRHSPRNRQVAAALNEAGFATLLMDLLTPDEDEVDMRTRELRFDIPLLAARLTAAVDRLAVDDRTARLPVITFGASTGAAAALICAADRPDRVRGVVSRGGRVDLAGEALHRLRVPALFVVGGDDPDVRRLNERAQREVAGRAELVVVPGASHLFEEPGALDVVIGETVQRLRAWTDERAWADETGERT